MTSAASSRFRVLQRSSRAPHTANLPRRHERTKALLPVANGLRGRFILIAAGVELGGGFRSVSNPRRVAHGAAKCAATAAPRSRLAASAPPDRSAGVNKSACAGPLDCDRLSCLL